MNNKHIILIIILAALLTISGCGMQDNLIGMMEEDSVRADAEDIISAIEEQDSEYLYNTYFSFFEKEEIYNGLDEIYEIYEGKTQNLQFRNINMKTIKGIDNDTSRSTKVVVYLVGTTESTYNLTLTYIKGESGAYEIIGINISENLEYVVNADMRNYTAANWILFLLNIASYGVMIVALILCIKTKIRKKALWIILILLQVGMTIIIFPNSFKYNVHILYFLGFNKYLLYGNGGTITSVFIHMFAIIFLFVRKSLNKRYIYYYGQQTEKLEEKPINASEETDKLINEQIDKQREDDKQ
ncbi:MAG: hypothetical protein AB1Z23_04735 [Eubacteriales bacterium]